MIGPVRLWRGGGGGGDRVLGAGSGACYKQARTRAGTHRQRTPEEDERGHDHDADAHDVGYVVGVAGPVAAVLLQERGARREVRGVHRARVARRGISRSETMNWFGACLLWDCFGSRSCWLALALAWLWLAFGLAWMGWDGIGLDRIVN